MVCMIWRATFGSGSMIGTTYNITIGDVKKTQEAQQKVNLKWLGVVPGLIILIPYVAPFEGGVNLK